MYRDEPSHHTWMGSAVSTLLPRLKNPAFFQKLALDLKNNRSELACASLQNSELNFTTLVAEMVANVTAKDGYAESTLQAIREELERRNELLAALLPHELN